ncbi:Antimony resistance marker of 58 kDa [Novymonas esmeraldas]|uniref:Antimony resistance marker of 58 kDa n=1 Tax=Novymonas esmeraldas TaxID=1808958 RepID=A0AAW0ESX9_9TRYP
MTELVPLDAVRFSNGEPLCAYHECYRCFDNRDILFRLVNVEKRQWFFFNDTTDTVAHVRAVFAPGSDIRPLQRAHLRVLPGPDGVVDATCSIEVTLDVEPGFTESFVEGEHKGFHLDFRTETAPARDVVFAYRRPTVPYDRIYRCFKNNGNGLLFRVVDERAGRWFFYNDTRDLVMTVRVTFADSAEVRALGSTTADAPLPDAAIGGVVYVLHIAPGRTEPFIEGTPTTYALEFAAEPVGAVDAPAGEESVHYLHSGPDAAIIPHRSHVFPCFKEHGNGLLFRVVDDVNGIWGFYNDTADYVMTANMRYPRSSGVRLAPGVQTLADEERADGVIAAVEVPPLVTVPFLVGAPEVFELAFSATPVTSVAPPPPQQQQQQLTPATNARTAPHGGDDVGPLETPPPALPVPEEAPVYSHAGPDAAVVPHVDEVYKCFKDHGNGLLFRLVDKMQRRWAFYNDTQDVVASVRVQFPPGARIQLLGHTVAGRDPETGGVLYELRVHPLETALFVQGDVDVFTTKFVAERVQT